MLSKLCVQQNVFPSSSMKRGCVTAVIKVDVLETVHYTLLERVTTHYWREFTTHHASCTAQFNKLAVLHTTQH